MTEPYKPHSMSSFQIENMEQNIIFVETSDIWKNGLQADPLQLNPLKIEIPEDASDFDNYLDNPEWCINAEREICGLSTVVSFTEPNLDNPEIYRVSTGVSFAAPKIPKVESLGDKLRKYLKNRSRMRCEDRLALLNGLIELNENKNISEWSEMLKKCAVLIKEKKGCAVLTKKEKKRAVLTKKKNNNNCARQNVFCWMLNLLYFDVAMEIPHEIYPKGAKVWEIINQNFVHKKRCKMCVLPTKKAQEDNVWICTEKCDSYKISNTLAVNENFACEVLAHFETEDGKYCLVSWEHWHYFFNSMLPHENVN
jgi:hypothetical protein